MMAITPFEVPRPPKASGGKSATRRKFLFVVPISGEEQKPGTSMPKVPAVKEVQEPHSALDIQEKVETITVVPSPLNVSQPPKGQR